MRHTEAVAKFKGQYGDQEIWPYFEEWAKVTDLDVEHMIWVRLLSAFLAGAIGQTNILIKEERNRPSRWQRN